MTRTVGWIVLCAIWFMVGILWGYACDHDKPLKNLRGEWGQMADLSISEPGYGSIPCLNCYGIGQ